MRKSVAYTYADGVIHFGDEVPRGALPIAIGEYDSLHAAVEVVARHGYTPGVLLVPGMPEADDQGEALKALRAFHDRVRQALMPAA